MKKISRAELRSIINETVFVNQKPRDPEDQLEGDFDRARSVTDFHSIYQGKIASAVRTRIQSDDILLALPADDVIEKMADALKQEIASESGKYTNIKLDDFLALIGEGELDEELIAMVDPAEDLISYFNTLIPRDEIGISEIEERLRQQGHDEDKIDDVLTDRRLNPHYYAPEDVFASAQEINKLKGR